MGFLISSGSNFTISITDAVAELEMGIHIKRFCVILGPFCVRFGAISDPFRVRFGSRF